MNQRKFGRTGLSVSELCLGAMQFGWLTNSETSHAILDAYRAAGGNFIQTSTCGPADAGPGLCRSEEIVGSWLQANPRARAGLVLSTRLRFARPVPGFRAGLADSIRRQCEESLRRLHASHLDLLVIEWSDALLPMDDVLGSIDDLVRAGKLRHVGAAGFPVWRFMESLGRSARLGGGRLESFQADYSLLERAPFEPDAIELAREYRVALLAQSPLAGGFLTGFYHLPQTPETARTRRLRERYGNVRGHAVLATLGDIGVELGATTGQVALAWVLTRGVVTAPLLGFLAPDQVREAASATALSLTSEHLDRLEAAARRLPGVIEHSLLETTQP
ncbi:MAG TPA: aldo/keto reductase [Lacunisphaera sp.]|jgi:aryl-alcohol dehydrogenase-like predicted oxidoreductase|nr:aldo/keto reductase [Lacunisphaera sp.]